MEEKDMREKINRLANGILDREIPELALSPERFDAELPADLRRRYDLVIDTDGITAGGSQFTHTKRIVLRHNSLDNDAFSFQRR